jgi:phosphopantetheinyl transferase (holo-ACP synthase)
LYGVAEAVAGRMGVKRTWLSLTHTSQNACAVVILED